MNIATKAWVSVEDYLEMEYVSELRHEYLDGEIREMGYASENHELIVANMVRLIGNFLLVGDYRVYPSNRLLHVPVCNRYYYADAMVVAGQPQFARYKRNMQATLNPAVLIEVLSDSTEQYDQRDKWACYQKIASLRHYVMVSQDRPLVETYARPDEHTPWTYTSADEPTHTINVLGGALTVSDIYHHIDF